MKYWSKSIVLLAVALGLLASCAELGMADPIKARQNLMRDNLANFKAISAYVKTGKGSAADVASRARHIADNAKTIKGLFPKGTSLKDRPGQTRAKPRIWAKKPPPVHNQAEDMAAFKQAADIMGVYAMRLAEAADSGDKKAIGAAMGKLINQGCNGCHKGFRGPAPKK
jgi:cytochrome c556